MKLLVIDNYDSFTYNLVHDAEAILGTTVTVRRNDALTLDEVADYDALLLSPGPGIPSEAGLLLDIIRRYATKKPMLGVCLGHQALGEAFGAALYNLPQVYHGIATPIKRTSAESVLLAGVERQMEVGRYHSWCIQPDSLPQEWVVTALDADGDIMAMRHEHLPLYGVQFHPESVLTPEGKMILANFFNKVQDHYRVAV